MRWVSITFGDFVQEPLFMKLVGSKKKKGLSSLFYEFCISFVVYINEFFVVYIYQLDQVLSVIFNKIFYESIKVIQKAVLTYHILFQNVIYVGM
jgi:hypothetical protein